jgi:hypothetical protein
MKTKILVDIQDYEDYQEVTFQQGKDFLYNLWFDDDGFTKEEHEKFLQEIENISTWEVLDTRLGGCDYTLFEDMEELRENQLIDEGKALFICNECDGVHENHELTCSNCNGDLRIVLKEELGL